MNGGKKTQTNANVVTMYYKEIIVLMNVTKQRVFEIKVMDRGRLALKTKLVTDYRTQFSFVIRPGDSGCSL